MDAYTSSLRPNDNISRTGDGYFVTQTDWTTPRSSPSPHTSTRNLQSTPSSNRGSGSVVVQGSAVREQNAAAANNGNNMNVRRRIDF